MKNIRNFIAILLLMQFMQGCSKQESFLPEEPTSFVTMYFTNNSVLGSGVGVKYQGEPLAGLGGTFLAGIGKFTFYNKNTGAILLEKELDVKPKDEPWYFFQPDSTIEPKLIRNTEVNEPAAPDGYMKVKIVNLSTIVLTNAAGVPYPRLNVVLWAAQGASVLVFTRYDTIFSVGRNLDTANYRLIKKAKKSTTGLIINNYRVSFIDPDTNQEILNAGGTVFIGTSGVSIDAGTNKKNVLTTYIVDVSRDPNNAYIAKGGKYYIPFFNKLFQ